MKTKSFGSMIKAYDARREIPIEKENITYIALEKWPEESEKK